MATEYARRATLDMFTTSERLGMDSVTQSFFDWLSLEDRERQEKYKTYRNYYNGEQEVMLTERQKQFLELEPHHDFSANYCQLVCDELARRLNIRGFNAGSQGGSTGKLWEWWQWGRMDSKQKNIHTSSIRDGDAYIITEWDNDNNRPRYYHNLAYDGHEGVKVHYDDESNEVSYASKRWNITTARDGSIGYRRRINLYFPDHIERYVSDDRIRDGLWTPFTEDGEEAVIDWTDTAGNPLGVPVTHFPYNQAGWRWGMSGLEQVIPLQNALNKAIVDLIAAADTTGFRVFYLIGESGLDADGNPLQISPGALMGWRNENAKFGAIPGEDLRPLIEVVDAFKISIAQVTETPLHLFQVSGQNASEGAQKQQEVGMISRAEEASVHFGNRWEDVMYLSRRLHNTFGSGEKMDEGQLIEALWKDFEVRDRVERVKKQGEALTFFTAAGGDYVAAAKYVGVDDENAEAMGQYAIVPLEYEKLNSQEQDSGTEESAPDQE